MGKDDKILQVIKTTKWVLRDIADRYMKYPVQKSICIQALTRYLEELTCYPGGWFPLNGFNEGQHYRFNGIWVVWSARYCGEEGFWPLFPYEDCGSGVGKCYCTKDKVFTYEENIWDAPERKMIALCFPPKIEEDNIHDNKELNPQQ